MPHPRRIAVIDVGKTNAKAVLVDAETGEESGLSTVPTIVRRDGPYPHFDVARTWDFLCDALAEMRRAGAIDVISIIAHGSAGAFLSGTADGDGLALPILDYEHDGPDELAAEYDAARPPFSETLSPRLPAGLNLGAQIFWQERRFPAAFAAAKSYVNYPQYWAWRLSGVAATEQCSMGAHSDMWRPRALDWSSMPERLGWTAKMAPLHSAFDRWPVRPELAKLLGLDASVLVLCGLHDSSASLLPHLKQRQPPFTVVSTGTWVILFAVGGDIESLDPKRDTLANVTVYGDPVPVGRFMGGREFDMLTAGDPAVASDIDIGRVLTERIMALPTFVPGVGPFPAANGRWTVDSANLSPSERNAAASLYVALVTAESIRCAGGSGPVVIEGPFARNRLFCSALSAIGGYAVEASETSTGTTLGAAMLATADMTRWHSPPKAVSRLSHPALAAYVEAWRKAAGAAGRP